MKYLILILCLLFGGASFYASSWLNKKTDSDQRGLAIWQETNYKLGIIINLLKDANND